MRAHAYPASTGRRSHLGTSLSAARPAPTEEPVGAGLSRLPVGTGLSRLWNCDGRAVERCFRVVRVTSFLVGNISCALRLSRFSFWEMRGSGSAGAGAGAGGGWRHVYEEIADVHLVSGWEDDSEWIVLVVLLGGAELRYSARDAHEIYAELQLRRRTCLYPQSPPRVRSGRRGGIVGAVHLTRSDRLTLTLLGCVGGETVGGVDVGEFVKRLDLSKLEPSQGVAIVRRFLDDLHDVVIAEFAADLVGSPAAQGIGDALCGAEGAESAQCEEMDASTVVSDAVENVVQCLVLKPIHPKLYEVIWMLVSDKHNRFSANCDKLRDMSPAFFGVQPCHLTADRWALSVQSLRRLNPTMMPSEMMRVLDCTARLVFSQYGRSLASSSCFPSPIGPFPRAHPRGCSARRAPAHRRACVGWLGHAAACPTAVCILHH
jgi:hypothetical protein